MTANSQSTGFKIAPQLGLAMALFSGGVGALIFEVPALAGSLIGAGASLLGTWIVDFNNKRSAKEDRRRREAEARVYLAPELNRTIDRILYIHGRAIPNFIAASTENGLKTNDMREDFIPYWPVLYPSAPQFRDLTGEDAVALVAYYDSLHVIDQFVRDWWQRDGQLPVNIFNSILHHANRSLKLALVCIERFEVERLCPPPYESWGTITSRIETSMKAEETAREAHMKRAEARKLAPPPQPPRRRG